MSLIDQCKNALQPFPFRRLVVGVSGGADSIALALVLKELGYDLVIAHLNHSLRGKESDEDAAFVRRFAKKLKVPCVIHTVGARHGAPLRSRAGNLEANARAARYAFLEEARQKYQADAIAVAHHRDDQIETILMNLYRGAGLRGLRGMQTVSGCLWRPFLEVPKKEILKFLQEKKQRHREDRTNDDTHYLRNKIRHLAIPLLRKTEPAFLKKLLEFSREADSELKRLAALSDTWINEQIQDHHFSRKAFGRLPVDIKSEIIIRLCGAEDLYSSSIKKIIAFIKTAASGKQMKIKHLTFSVEYDKINTRSFVPKNSWIITHQRVLKKGLNWNGWSIEVGSPKLKPRSKKLKTLRLHVRSWLPGDRFQPAGMQGIKKIQDFFANSKIPRAERHTIPIVVDDAGDILVVGNLRWSEKAKKKKLDQYLTIKKNEK